MHLFVTPGERVFVVLTSAGACRSGQSVLTLLRQDYDEGIGLATAETFYDAARVVGDKVRIVSKCRSRST